MDIHDTKGQIMRMTVPDPLGGRGLCSSWAMCGSGHFPGAATEQPPRPHLGGQNVTPRGEFESLWGL